MPVEALHKPAAALVAKWKKGLEAEKPAAAEAGSREGAGAADAAKAASKRPRWGTALSLLCTDHHSHTAQCVEKGLEAGRPPPKAAAVGLGQRRWHADLAGASWDASPLHVFALCSSG